MSLSTILTFVLVAGLLIISPGPNGVLIAKTVPKSGKAAGFANIAGFFTAFYIHGTLAIFGWSAILVKSSEFFFFFKLLGAAYLSWIGLKALHEACRGRILLEDASPDRKKRTLMAAYGEGLLTNMLNPKVSMFYLAAFPQFISPAQATLANAYTLVFIHSMLNVAWFGLMVLFFARFVGLAKSNRTQRWIKGITGTVFLGFGAKLATFRP
ncbi:LysE family translocator [Pararhizobium sp. LjRoot238]|uniref:LysE family translocator n=1 Tax=Pararhizobium sp. LjRoot238 TaxID=3342293 RepID=UPI003ECC3F21